jgi:serine protease
MTPVVAAVTVSSMAERGRAPKRRRVASLVLFAAAVAVLPVIQVVRARSELPQLGVLQGDPHALDDGYRHYVVALSGTPTADLGIAARGPAGATPAAPPADPATRLEIPVAERNGRITPEALDAVSTRGRVVEIARRADGRLVAVVEDLTSLPPDAGLVPLPASREPAAGATGDGPAQLLAVPGTRHVESRAPGVFVVTTSAGPDAYRDVPGVGSVETDPIATVASDDTYWSSQWHLENTGQRIAGVDGVPGTDLGVTDAWAVADGGGRVVAVIDTGTDISHPDLAGSLWHNPRETCGNNVDDDGNGYVDDCVGWDFFNDDPTVNDAGSDNRHATHIAGTIAAGTGNGRGVAGVAPGARVMPLKISNGNTMQISDATEALYYAVDNGADIVNCSFGTGAGVARAQMAGFEAAVAYAGSRGVLVVAAAGNEGVDIDASPRYPAALPEDNLISVAASTSEDQRASFSNWGRVGVDLHAPGVNIVATLPDGQYGGMSGTSMASPTVAAAAAVVWSARPDLDGAGVKALLLDASPAVPAFAGRTVSGRRLDVGEIVNPGGDGVSFRVDGLAAARADAPLNLSVAARVVPQAVPAGDRVRYRATLLTERGGQVYGVVGAPATTSSGDSATGADAAVELGDAAGYDRATASGALPLSLALPAGRYGLVAEAYTAADGTTIGRPWVVYFDVPEPSTAVTPTSPPPSGGSPSPPAPGPPTTGPPPTTGAPGASSPPTTGPGTTTPPAGTPPAPAPTTRATDPPSAPTPLPTAPATTPPPLPGTPAPTPAAPGPAAPPPGAAPVAPPPPAPSPTTAPPAPAVTTAPAPSAPPIPPAPATGPSPTRPAGPTVTAPPLAPVPPAVSGDGFTVRSVSPRYGSTEGGEMVVISGSGFTGNLYVLFGGRQATGWAVSPTMLVVTTPAHTAGPVDIEVGTVGAGSVVYRGGYDYRAPDPVTGTVPTPGRPLPAPGEGGSGSPAPAPAPVPAPAAPAPPGGPTPPSTAAPGAPAPPSVETSPPTTAAAPIRVPVRFSFGDEQEAGGLRLRPVTGGPALAAADGWAARACNLPTCAASRL